MAEERRAAIVAGPADVRRERRAAIVAEERRAIVAGLSEVRREPRAADWSAADEPALIVRGAPTEGASPGLARSRRQAPPASLDLQAVAVER